VKGRVILIAVGIAFPRKRLVKSRTRRLRGNADQQRPEQRARQHHHPPSFIGPPVPGQDDRPHRDRPHEYRTSLVYDRVRTAMGNGLSKFPVEERRRRGVDAGNSRVVHLVAVNWADQPDLLVIVQRRLAQPAAPGHLLDSETCHAGSQTHLKRLKSNATLPTGPVSDAQSFLEEFFPGRADEFRQYQDGPWLV